MYREHSSHWSMKLYINQFTTWRGSSTIVTCNYLSKILEKNSIGEWRLEDFLSVSRLHSEFFWTHLTIPFTFEWNSSFCDSIAISLFQLMHLYFLISSILFCCWERLNLNAWSVVKCNKDAFHSLSLTGWSPKVSEKELIMLGFSQVFKSGS